MKEKVFLGKGIRRVLSLMFCLAVCLILIPMTASAAEEKTPITQVSIRGMERLYAGESVARDDLKKLITVSTTSSSTDISDAVNVDRVRWIDAETGKEATEIVEGHKYRLEVVLRTNANYYFEKDGTDSTKFGGRVFMYLSSMGASPYSVVLGRNYLLSVESQEMTALPPAFTTQPVGGTNVAGKHFIINYETGSSDDRVYLESWDGDKWVTWDKEGQSNTTSFGVYTYYASGTTEKFRLRIDNGIGVAVYSDEFEVMWAVDYFTTQPVGGVFVCTKTGTITFAHADRKNNVQLQKYDTEEGKWQTMQNLGEATSYDIPGGKIHTKDTYRLEIVDGGGKGISVYSDEFEIMWADTTGHYATDIHLGAHQVYVNQGETYTTYVERGQHKYIEPNIWGIKAGTTDVEYAHRQIAITFLSEVTSSKTKAIGNLYPEGLRIEVGEDEELDEIMIKVAYRVDPSIYAYLRIIVDEGGTIFYRSGDGRFKRTLNETASFNAPYKLQDYADVIPPYGKVFKCWMYDRQEYRPGDTITFVKDPDDDDYINYVTAIYMDNPFTSKPNNVTIACNNPEAERTIAFNFTKTGTIEKVVLECDDVSTGGTFKKAYKSFDLSKRFSWGDDGNKALNIEAQTEWAGICRFAFTMNGVIYYSSSFRININPDCHVWQFLGITEYPTETTSGAAYYRCTYCDERKSIQFDGSFVTAPRNVYVKDYGTETNGFAVSVPINGWTIEVKKNNKYETFLSSHAEESHAGGESIEFTCGYDVDDVWPDENPYRIKVTVDNNGIFYSEPFMITDAIKSVKVTDLDKPVAGETLDYNVTIRTNPGYSEVIKASEIGWVKTGTNLKLSNTEKAVNGQSYNCEIILTPAVGYGFEKREDGSYVTDISCSWGKANTQVDDAGKLHITFGPVKAEEPLPVITEQPVISSLSSNAAGVQVTWGAVDGVTQYRVFYKTATGAWTTFANVKGTSTTVTGLKSGTAYSFLVRCLSADGKSYTDTYDAAKSKSITYIAQPAVSSLANAANGVEVKWSAVGGAAQYRVFYKAAGGAWTGFGNTKGTSLVVTGLTAGKTYSFTVRCVSADGKSYTSTYDTTGKSIVYQPAAATMLAKPEITALSSNSAGVQVTWGAVAGAAQYRVFYKTATGAWTTFANVKGTSTTVTGLTSGTTYTFLVRCLSEDAKSYTSDYDAAKSKSHTYIAQPAVSSLSNTSIGVEVKWNAVPGAAQYRVFYKAAGGAWTGFNNTTGNSLVVTGLTAGTTYSFTVRCVSADGKSYTSTYDAIGKSIVYQPTTNTMLEKPEITALSSNSAGVQITWGAVSGAAQYRVFYKTATGAWTAYGNTNATSMVVTGLTSGTTYSFLVRCLSADGKAYTSDYDASKSKSHTYIAQPAVSSVTNTANGVEVKWNAVGGAAQYRVFYKPAGGAWTGYKNTTGTSMTVTSLTKGTTYSFTVRCVSADGKSYTSTYDTTGKSIKVE